MESYDFFNSRVGEPHSRRRNEIFGKYPEIKTLYGFDSKTSYAVIGIVLIQFSIATLFQYAPFPLFRSTWTMIVISYFLGAICNHACAMAIHECSHGLAASTLERNRYVALLANFPIPLPGAMSFCRYHMGHHVYLGIERKDNDLPSRWEVNWVKNSRIRKALWLFFYFFFATLGRGFINRPNRWEAYNILIQLAVNFLVIYFLGKTAFFYLCLSTFFAFSAHPVAGHYIHEHYRFSNDEQETYSYYGPLNRVTFNVGYHNEHHDFMGVPGSRLPELKKIANEYYGKLQSHRSWSSILWRFIMDRKLGHFSRIVRSYEVFRQSRGPRAI